MTTTQTGLLAGLIIGLAAAFGTFGGVVVVMAAGFIGLVVGPVLEGKLDLNELLGRGRDRGTHPTDPGDRGTTTIAPLVLRKVVEHACDGTGTTVSVPRSFAGRDVGALGERGSAATVTELAPAAVAVRLEVALRRPAEVRRAAGAVRRAVEKTLAGTTGHHVRSMDLVIVALSSAGAGRVA